MDNSSDISKNKSDFSQPALPVIKKYIIVAAGIIAVIALIYYIVFREPLLIVPFLLGLAITSTLNIIKIRMLGNTVNKVLEMTDQDAGKNSVRLAYILRYFLTGIVLVAIGLIHNYTTPPPFFSERETYFGLWSIVFPNSPEYFREAPLISIWGGLAGVFTMQIALIITRTKKLEIDGTDFIEYVDDEDILTEKDDEDVTKT